MNANGWIAIGAVMAPTMLLFAIGWASLKARLAVIEALLSDLTKRPPQWCIDQQRECSRCYEHREITGVGQAGHA